MNVSKWWIPGISIPLITAMIVGSNQADKQKQEEAARQVAMSPAEKKREEDFQYWSRKCGTNDALDVVKHPNDPVYLQRCVDKMVKKFQEE